jgi:hypothetical protein
MQTCIKSTNLLKEFFSLGLSRMDDLLDNITLISQDDSRPSPTFSCGSREMASAKAASRQSRRPPSAEIKSFSGFSNRETRKFPNTGSGFSLL